MTPMSVVNVHARRLSNLLKCARDQLEAMKSELKLEAARPVVRLLQVTDAENGRAKSRVPDCDRSFQYGRGQIRA